jgi:hypothetical protein
MFDNEEGIEPEEDIELPKSQQERKKKLDMCKDCDFVDRFETKNLKKWIKKFAHRRTKSLRYIG